MPYIPDSLSIIKLDPLVNLGVNFQCAATIFQGTGVALTNVQDFRDALELLANAEAEMLHQEAIERQRREDPLGIGDSINATIDEMRDRIRNGVYAIGRVFVDVGQIIIEWSELP